MKHGFQTLIYKVFCVSYVNEMKNSFWLKILKKYYILVGFVADETDLQIFHIVNVYILSRLFSLILGIINLGFVNYIFSRFII